MATPDDFNLRFGGIARLYGRDGLARLRAARVCVIGVGGVGTWAAESLARSGIGELTLVDLDDVCVTNVNRQLPALDGEIGKPKIAVMKDRIRAINPECRVNAMAEFFTAATASAILEPGFDYVLDAIDNFRNKCLLIATCRKKKIPIITAGGAGGRRDPTAITLADLSRTVNDPLLQMVRKHLRKDYGFPRERRHKFRVDCVFSPELPLFPQSDGTVCATKDPETNLRLDCESGYGTASFITGTFGFFAAARIVDVIAGGKRERQRAKQTPAANAGS